jgi:hypothetical protein
MMRDSTYFEYLKEWIGTLSKGEYGEIASSVSSLDLDHYKKCQLFCLELQCKYFQFCMKSEDVQGQLTYLDQQQEYKLDGSYHEKQNIFSSFTEKEQHPNSNI